MSGIILYKGLEEEHIMLFLWCPNEISNNVSYPDALKTWTFYEIVGSVRGILCNIVYRLKFHTQNNLAEESTTTADRPVFPSLQIE